MEILEKQNQRLDRENMARENDLKSLKKDFSEASEKEEIQRRENTKLKEQNTTLESNVLNQNKELNKLQLKIAVLEQQSLDKQDVLNKTTALLKLAETHKQEIEESLQLYKKNHASLQSKLEQSVQEINKGNHIIEKIHAENREFKSKTRMKTRILKQQESMIGDLQKKLDEISGQYNQMTTDYHNAQNTIGVLEVVAISEYLDIVSHFNRQTLNVPTKKLRNHQNC